MHGHLRPFFESTEHDFDLEKQLLMRNAKLEIQEECKRKEKEREVNKRMCVSECLLEILKTMY